MLPTFTYNVYGGRHERLISVFEIRSFVLSVRLSHLCIMMINSQGLRENEAHLVKGNLGDFNKGIVHTLCAIEGKVQEACRVLCV